MKKQATWAAIAAGCILFSLHFGSYAVDSASLEFAAGNKTQMTRIGLQWMWKEKWWQSNGTHIGGHWDLTMAYWRGDRFQNIAGNTQSLASIGITPVFRLQNDTLKGWYAEAGIGAHYLSDLYDNNSRRFSTKFQFGDHIAVGYVFQNNLDLGLKIQHFSNASIKKPNPGVNFTIIRASYPF